MLLVHKLLHQVVTGKMMSGFEAVAGLDPDHVKRLHSLIEAIAPAQKFATKFGLLASQELLDTGAELWRAGVLRPPFDVTWWEIETQHYCEGILVRHDRASRRTTMDAFCYSGGNWIDAGLQSFTDPTSTPPEGASLYYHEHSSDPKFFEDYALRIMQHVIAACCLLTSKAAAVEVVEAPPKLNAKRAKRGKPPLFEHRVITIPGFEAAAASETGTHASPRLHWRRGHVRKLPSGDLTAVRPCLVGLVERGVISKDYLIALGINGDEQ